MAKILIYSPNVISKSMAGAAIRSWEFAKALSKKHQVILFSPDEANKESSSNHSEPFQILPFLGPSSKKHFKDADILITQRLTFPLACLVIRYRLKIIIDAYVPRPFELLEHFKWNQSHHRSDRTEKVFSEITNILFSFKFADAILCASEKQRGLWLGFLLGQKIITPSLYDQDPSLRHFLTVIPFGLSSHLPEKTGQGLREKLGFSSSDKILLWAGGIWNWFDPLTLIKAMKIISEVRSDVKLVFMGVKPPDPMLSTPSMAMEAIALAKEIGVINQSVFFNHEWIPYEERQNFLLDGDIGVSIHFDLLETDFSFRTRMLDYLWAALPIVATEGDSFAELIKRDNLGKIVPYQNEKAMAEAILSLVGNPDQLREMKSRVVKARELFFWDCVTEPLFQLIDRLQLHSPSKNRWKETILLFSFIVNKIRERGLFSSLKQYIKGCMNHLKNLGRS